VRRPPPDSPREARRRARRCSRSCAMFPSPRCRATKRSRSRCA
jgi:hypothetical protein